MGKVITIDVEFSDVLSEHVTEVTGKYGLYENVGDYVHELIRRDQESVEQARLEVLKSKLQRAFATPAENFVQMDVDGFLERMRRRTA